jgi:hypothetical protein
MARERCSICRHPLRVGIEEMLQTTTYLVVAAAFRVSVGALSRHRHGCLEKVEREVEREVERSEHVEQEVEQAQTPSVGEASAGRPHLVYDVSLTEAEPGEPQPLEVLKQGLPYVRRAVRLAGRDEARQQELVRVLNDALQEEQMGL